MHVMASQETSAFGSVRSRFCSRTSNLVGDEELWIGLHRDETESISVRLLYIIK